MKYWLLPALILLVACSPQPQPLPAPLPTAEMAVAQPPLYFPIAVKSAPLVADQRVGPEVCMAWSGQYLDAAQRDFGSQLYYHSATWRVPSVTAVPIVRARPGQREDIAEQLLYLKSIDWRGLVLLANEPDMPDQDAIAQPRDMAGLYWYATQLLPNATFVTPNTISIQYLDQFLDYATLRSKDRVGVHVYQGAAGTAVHTWPAVWLQNVERVLAQHGVHNALWISEVGIDEAWSQLISDRYARELFNSRAEVVCVYTTTCGNWLPGCGYDLYKSGAALTTGGNALKSVVRPADQQAAYP